MPSRVSLLISILRPNLILYIRIACNFTLWIPPKFRFLISHESSTRRLGRVYHTRHAGYFSRVLPVPDPWVAWVWHSTPYPKVALGTRIKVYPGIGYGPGTTRVEYSGRSGSTLYTLPNVPDPWVTYYIP